MNLLSVILNIILLIVIWMIWVRWNKAKQELSRLKHEVQEGKVVKEKYIRYFFEHCIAYVEKIREYQQMANQKIKSGEINDLYRINCSTHYIQRANTDFHPRFDKAFLELYPTFVEEFNELLEDEGKCYIQEGDLLNPELRIYALNRLGITDTTLIAHFMGYSPVTVYSCRNDVKKRAKDKEQFDRAVSEIGKNK